MKEKNQNTVVISPAGVPDRDLIAGISREITLIFGYPTRTEPLLKDLEFALDSGRDQYHSTEILERLARVAARGIFKIVAVVDVDLFIPILTHVYGEAQLGGRACVVSTYRLRQSTPFASGEEAYRQRITKEAVHELGHTFRLRHCKDPSCIMHYCRRVEDVDRKSNRLCRYCRVLLEDEKERLGFE